MATVYEYEVEGLVGTFGFPEDMLRYDRAEHVAKVGEEVRSPRLKRERHKIRGKRYPTVARWNSFGWRVFNVTHEEVEEAG